MYRYFRPNGPATRGQIAKIVSQAAGWFDPAGNQIFEDVAPGSTFYDYIQRLSLHNAVTGYRVRRRGGAMQPAGQPSLFPPGQSYHARPAIQDRRVRLLPELYPAKMK